MRTLCKIAIPVTLQGMLQASFSIVNQIMIGQLGEAGIAAVGLPHRDVLLSAHGGQHRPVRMAALQGTRRCPLLGKFWRGSGEHRAENYLLIFGKLGAPAMGVTGAAIATLVSQLLNLLLILIGFAVCLQKEAERPLTVEIWTELHPIC